MDQRFVGLVCGNMGSMDSHPGGVVWSKFQLTWLPHISFTASPNQGFCHVLTQGISVGMVCATV